MFVWNLLIVRAALYDDEYVTAYFIDDTISFIDAAAPVVRKVIAQWLWLAYAVVGVAQHILYQFIDTA